MKNRKNKLATLIGFALIGSIALSGCSAPEAVTPGPSVLVAEESGSVGSLEGVNVYADGSARKTHAEMRVDNIKALSLFSEEQIAERPNTVACITGNEDGTVDVLFVIYNEAPPRGIAEITQSDSCLVLAENEVFYEVTEDGTEINLLRVDENGAHFVNIKENSGLDADHILEIQPAYKIAIYDFAII